ncbi:MAG: class I SAM-dependent methyltransferase [Alicyclobacillus sp.]|nr:class I SAM-dependent methyltransferase [Alicyclobacillus sp.]
MSQLSPRLAGLAAWVPLGSRLLDVGTDHALLPIALVQSGRVVSAVASDIARGPVERARDNVRQAGLEAQIAVRQGPGLSTVSAGEVDVIVIAGMGGGTAAGILEEAPDIARCATRLLLQPMNGAARLRRCLLDLGFETVEEDMVEEGARSYQLMAVEPRPKPGGERPRASWLTLAFGPVNLRRTGDERVRRAVWEEREHMSGIVDRLAAAPEGSEAARRRVELEARIHEADAWLHLGAQREEGGR